MKTFVVALALFALTMIHDISFAAEERYFDSAGAQLRYFIEGNGTPVILLHGFSG